MLIGLDWSRDATVFIRGERVSAHSARPRKRFCAKQAGFVVISMATRFAEAWSSDYRLKTVTSIRNSIWHPLHGISIPKHSNSLLLTSSRIKIDSLITIIGSRDLKYIIDWTIRSWTTFLCPRGTTTTRTYKITVVGNSESIASNGYITNLKLFIFYEIYRIAYFMTPFSE